MRRQSARALPLVLLLLGFQACGLEKVENAPDLSGPSELGLALTVRANPDWVVADNESVSDITATLRGPNGQPLGGRGILFVLADASAKPAAIGELSTVTGEVIAGGQSATAVTNSSGVAQVRFSAPARTDILSATSVVIGARPMGDDANAAIYRTVRVEVVPAESRLFPPNPDNKPPTCAFAVQPSVGPGGVLFRYPVGFQILFQSTSSDADGRIVRYEWNFGDDAGPGSVDTKPDVNHAYGRTGAFTVTHRVTDNNGAQVTCTQAVTIY